MKGGMAKSKECWVVTDGRAGIENQALGLAEAVARETDLIVTRKRISVAAPWRLLPRLLWGDPFSRLARDGALLRPPYPDLWIGCGRMSVPLTMAAKKRSPDTFTVQLQNPRAPLNAFDLVIPPEHDRINANNVFSILGSPNRITSAKLSADAEALAPLIDHLPSPRVAVLIGGSNSANKVDQAQAERLISVLETALESGVGLMVTTSRRTPESILKALGAFDSHDHIFLWTDQDSGFLANPYFGMLGAADHILVTEDSVNMAGEAALTGQPVHIYRWRDAGHRKPRDKFSLFLEALEAQGACREFSGRFDRWAYAPLDETHRAAVELVRRWDDAMNARLRATFAAN